MTTRIPDWVAYNARRHSERIAVENLDSGVALTWREFDDKVARMAAVLADTYNVGAGDRIGLVADNDWYPLALQFACFRLGAVFVPFNWRLSAHELEVLCRDADLTVLVHDAVWAETSMKLAETLSIPRLGWNIDGERDLDSLLAAAERRPTPHSYDGEQVAQILYTSGTTGLPKGAIITLSGITFHALNVSVELRMSDPRNRYLSALPLFHAAGLNAFTNPILMSGGRISIMPRFDPGKAAQLLGDPRNGFTHLSAAPVMWRMMMENAPESADFSALQAAQVGGGAIPEDVAAYFAEHGAELVSGWGATEMGPSITLMPSGFARSKATTVGFPVPCVEVRVVDPATGVDVEPGEIGEAWVRGPAISPGYWRRDPEDPKAHAEGWFRSGDAISLDADGFIALRGRFKDMYKSGGENVFTAEVERTINELDSVVDVAVLGVPDERWGEVGCAVVVVAGGHTVSEDEIVTHCTSRLAKYKVPKKIVVVDELPRNVTGKIQKNLLKELVG